MVLRRNAPCIIPLKGSKDKRMILRIPPQEKSFNGNFIGVGCRGRASL